MVTRSASVKRKKEKKKPAPAGSDAVFFGAMGM